MAFDGGSRSKGFTTKFQAPPILNHMWRKQPDGSMRCTREGCTNPIWLLGASQPEQKNCGVIGARLLGGEETVHKRSR